ncbi:MAG: hypothetical protein ACD_10C00504G0003 [uncultured bacterium]|nr:MAG: hypothetical protein ACD_10C00504G0003 [uncultured bacterium]
MILLDRLQLAEQPLTVADFDFFVALTAGVPAAEQRFGGDHEYLVLDARHDFKAAIENQADTGEAAM